MARLSKRAFNNVVIFAMLGMIFLFNIDRFLPETKLPVNQPLLPDGVYVLKIEQGSKKLERVGQQWRWTGVNQALSSKPESQIQAWRTTAMQAAKPPRAVTQTEPLVVVVWIAGQSNGLVYAFATYNKQLWVQFDNQWYSISPDTTITQLLPWLINEQEM